MKYVTNFSFKINLNWLAPDEYDNGGCGLVNK